MSKPFRSDKRKKELQRLQKQEEKRQRRFGKKQGQNEVTGIEPMEGENGTFEDNDIGQKDDQTEAPDPVTAASEEQSSI